MVNITDHLNTVNKNTAAQQRSVATYVHTVNVKL